MKIFYKSVLIASAALVLGYYASFFIMPSITIVNNSSATITSAHIGLPSSNLDFGSIPSGDSNTLHYDLSQAKDGVYRYHIKISEAVAYQDVCGYVTNNELNKRVVITVHQDLDITCN